MKKIGSVLLEKSQQKTHLLRKKPEQHQMLFRLNFALWNCFRFALIS